jgi:hypothetical protein
MDADDARVLGILTSQTLNLKPYTLHPTPYTLQYTLNRVLGILQYTLNRVLGILPLQTLNPAP